MKVKFFGFEKDTGRINIMLPELPENDFINEKKIVYEVKIVMNGIKWEAMDWEYTEEGIEIDNIPFKYKYVDNEIIENPDYGEDDEVDLWR